mgnify:CR=1 FL=1
MMSSRTAVGGRRLGTQLPDGVSGIPAVHPDRIPNILNCSSVYSAREFEKTKMFGPGGNFGLHCRETITLNIAVNKAEEGVIF